MKTLVAITLFIILSSCCGGGQTETRPRYLYINDNNISDISGRAVDTIYLNYFPEKCLFMLRDSVYIQYTGVKHFNPVENELNRLKAEQQKRKFLSFYIRQTPDRTLYWASEPILSNVYLGKDLYRFTWSRSFHRPIIFTLTNDDGEIILSWKKLPNYITGRKFDSDIEFGEKELSFESWTYFEKIINDVDFWNMEPLNETMDEDGADWTIEGHTKNNYWFVSRGSPKDEFQKCGEYLIKASGLEEKIY